MMKRTLKWLITSLLSLAAADTHAFADHHSSGSSHSSGPGHSSGTSHSMGGQSSGRSHPQQSGQHPSHEMSEGRGSHYSNQSHGSGSHRGGAPTLERSDRGRHQEHTTLHGNHDNGTTLDSLDRGGRQTGQVHGQKHGSAGMTLDQFDSAGRHPGHVTLDASHGTGETGSKSTSHDAGHQGKHITLHPQNSSGLTLESLDRKGRSASPSSRQGEHGTGKNIHAIVPPKPSGTGLTLESLDAGGKHPNPGYGRESGKTNVSSNTAVKSPGKGATSSTGQSNLPNRKPVLLSTVTKRPTNASKTADPGKERPPFPRLLVVKVNADANVIGNEMAKAPADAVLGTHPGSEPSIVPVGTGPDGKGFSVPGVKIPDNPSSPSGPSTSFTVQPNNSTFGGTTVPGSGSLANKGGVASNVTFNATTFSGHGTGGGEQAPGTDGGTNTPKTTSGPKTNSDAGGNGPSGNDSTTTTTDPLNDLDHERNSGSSGDSSPGSHEQSGTDSGSTSESGTGSDAEDPGSDAPSKHSYKTRYLRVGNGTNERIKLFLRYRTQAEDGNWTWYPGRADESAEPMVIQLEPGEIADLLDHGWRINADRVRIWAKSENRKWVRYKSQDFALVPETSDDGEHMYYDDSPQVAFYSFNDN